MRFTFDPDQIALRDAVRDFLAGECQPSDVRAAWESTHGWSADRWAKLAQLGVVGATAPTALGGLGFVPIDWVLLLEEAGRAAVPEPLLEHTAVGLSMLGAFEMSGWPDAASWLESGASGGAMVTVGVEQNRYVNGAANADLLVLFDARREEVVALQRSDRESAVLTPQPALDGTRRLFLVARDEGVGSVVARGDTAASFAERAFNLGALAAAAELLGIAAKMIDLASAYAREREQFGQPIGAFQAVKHHLANALVAIERARPVVYRAAWTMSATDAGSGLAGDADVDVSMAKAYASDAAVTAAEIALQVHGAIGYTWECDLHLWMKRAWALAASWGDARWHRARVGASLMRAATQPPRG